MRLGEVEVSLGKIREAGKEKFLPGKFPWAGVRFVSGDLVAFS